MLYRKLNVSFTLQQWKRHQSHSPIGLCNVLYKIIIKLLVTCLKSHIDKIISKEQAAFIPGSMISDNVLIVHELMHSLKSRKRVSQTYMTIKTDITKAYDRVEWKFMESVMRAFGFCDKWMGWIMATIRTITYYVLINGNPQGYITSKRGLRRGNPLSPYLFIPCVDVLSHLVCNLSSKNKIRGINIGNGVPTITYMLFADDSIFFCQANTSNCAALKKMFELYEQCSGQKINPSKSMITFGS